MNCLPVLVRVVLAEVALGRKLHVALLAPELPALVRRLVLAERRHRLEPLVAHGTRVRLCRVVHVHVLLEVALRREAFVAVRAGEGLLPVVLAASVYLKRIPEVVVVDQFCYVKPP